MFRKAYPIICARRVKFRTPVLPVKISLIRIRWRSYLSLMAGITPLINLGDQVFISAVEDGVVIHGVFTPIEAPTRASFGFKDDKLVIESQHAVILKSGDTTIELTEAGSIRIDGKEVRTKAKEVHTVAQKTLTLLGGTVNLN